MQFEVRDIIYLGVLLVGVGSSWAALRTGIRSLRESVRQLHEEDVAELKRANVDANKRLEEHVKDMDQHVTPQVRELERRLYQSQAELLQSKIDNLRDHLQSLTDLSRERDIKLSSMASDIQRLLAQQKPEKAE